VRLSYVKALSTFGGAVSAKGGVGRYEAAVEGERYGHWEESVRDIDLLTYVTAPAGRWHIDRRGKTDVGFE
jgi:hypothetical protein